METLFPFIIMALYVLISWYVKKRQTDNEAGRAPSPSHEGEKDWDDLMEALGQKSSQKRPEPVQPIAPQQREAAQPTPPVVVAAPPKKTTPPLPAFPKGNVERKPQTAQRPAYEASIPRTIAPKDNSAADALSIEEEMKSLEVELTLQREAAAKLKKISSQSKDPHHEAGSAKHAMRLLGRLHDRQTLRDAVVLNEILNPPLALR